MAYSGKYRSPSELIADDGTSREEKIRMLKSWRDDKEAYLRATEEGMKGRDRSDYLRQIEQAITRLGGDDE